MKKILVTGGAGFIGSNFVRYLLANDPEAEVVNFDKLTYAGNLDNLRDLDPSRHTFVRGDIGDAAAVFRAMTGCDAVVNFAAETHVDRSILGASEFINTDIRGVHSIVEAAKELGTRRVLLVSTDEVYGDVLKGSSKETDPIAPRNPYSASKAGGEMMGMAYFNTFGVPVIVTRGSNTYGPYQYPEKLIPLFVTNAIDNEPLPLYGDGSDIRDWLFVEDHCRGIDCALRNGTPGEVYNIAGGNERTNLETTRTILQLLGKSEDLIHHMKDRPGHDHRYSLDATKLKGLGWAPRTDWSRGMELTIRWYRENEWWWRKLKNGEFLDYYRRQMARH